MLRGVGCPAYAKIVSAYSIGANARAPANAILIARPTSAIAASRTLR